MIITTHTWKMKTQITLAVVTYKCILYIYIYSFAYVFKTDSIPKSSILNFNIITYIRLSSEFRVFDKFSFSLPDIAN